MRFWISDCCGQLGLGLPVFRKFSYESKWFQLEVQVEGPRPQGKDLSWRSSKVLWVFLRNFPMGFGGFSPISELSFSAPYGAKTSIAPTVFRFSSLVSHWVRRFFYQHISALPRRTPRSQEIKFYLLVFLLVFLSNLGGFSLIDLSVFLHSFSLRFGGFLSIPEARVFLLIERFFSTANQRTLLSTTQATASSYTLVGARVLEGRQL